MSSSAVIFVLLITDIIDIIDAMKSLSCHKFCCRFYRAMHKRGICCHLSVRASITFVSCAKTNKDIFGIFSPSGSQAILVFPYHTGWRYSDGNPPNGGVECKGYEKSRFSTIIFTNISLYLRNGYR